MRAVVQKCSYCRVLSENETAGKIGAGLVVFLGVKKEMMSLTAGIWRTSC